MTEQEFVRQRDCELLRANKYIGTKEYAQLSQVNKKLEVHLVKAQQVISQMKVFNFDLYEEKRSGGQASVDGIYSAFLAKIASLEAEERIGTAITYQCALKSLQNFYPKSKLPLESITIKFLQSYERWMLENGNSLTTVGFYLRNLRAVMNSILDNNKQKMDEYPFGPRKYIIPTKKNSKRALSNEDLKKLISYHPDEQEEKYLSFWLFMYLANGMNPTDMVRLKYKDLRSDRIVFLREKTKRTNRESTLIEVHLNPVLKEIIEKWGNYPDPDNYIFPVLNDVTSAARAKKIITQFVKQINKYMRRIGEKLEIDKQITTYVARHSFVTKLISEGGTLMEVKSMTGHKSITTTEGYVGSIEDERLKKITSRLLNF
ncbi:integrase [Dyadobacter sp. BE34]|uniref:Integrase n=1 Tax=Dyadobacter fermentans TaxID=94254 RepID=A0ABU1R285_9BACT|nr:MULTISPECIES: site-specific integrase [Dyadobacter]MDR6807513.1 integrase [Dyadobacter fermentans]MDR7045254.1 integrase [Dyadobacter sp. BE242]MDR7199567.1 integrase [Dyadobacter sp. BE34]MDR7217974.1 integrase [Dyadobacter sp. BE31]MDR7265458.1 integrase [Dyadobacter sp. BE32]